MYPSGTGRAILPGRSAVVVTGPAFVAGATGYTGRAVVRTLASRGIETWAHIRPDSPGRERWTERFRALGARVDTTPWSEDALCATLARIAPTLVFALLGTTSKRAKAAARDGRDAGYDAVDYGLTAMLLRCTPATARFVYLSSVGVGPDTRNPYLATRWKLESELRESGRDWVIARPSFITGPDREEHRPAERLAAPVSDALLGLAAAFGARRLRDRYRSLDADTLAAGLVRHALDPAARGRTLEAADLR